MSTKAVNVLLETQASTLILNFDVTTLLGHPIILSLIVVTRYDNVGHGNIGRVGEWRGGGGWLSGMGKWEEQWRLFSVLYSQDRLAVEA